MWRVVRREKNRTDWIREYKEMNGKLVEVDDAIIVKCRFTPMRTIYQRVLFRFLLTNSLVFLLSHYFVLKIPIALFLHRL